MGYSRHSALAAPYGASLTLYRPSEPFGHLALARLPGSAHLHALAHLSDDPIMVFISSPGGHVESGDMIFDAIRFIKPKVITIGSGWVASAGSLIYVAADKENRYSLPNTRFLLHQPSGGFQGRALDVKIYAKEILWMKDRLNKIFAKATGQPLERIAADTERDFWLSAEEAVEYGLVNKIVTTEAEIIQ